MEGLVGLCDEAGLGELGGRHALCVFNAITWRQDERLRKQSKQSSYDAETPVGGGPSMPGSTVMITIIGTY